MVFVAPHERTETGWFGLEQKHQLLESNLDSTGTFYLDIKPKGAFDVIYYTATTINRFLLCNNYNQGYNMYTIFHVFT